MSTDLTRALVGNRHTLYGMSPYFKTAIDTLVEMLPLWVDGIAEGSMRMDRDVHRRVQEQMKQPFLPLPPHLLDLTKDARRDVGVTEWRDR